MEQVTRYLELYCDVPIVAEYMEKIMVSSREGCTHYTHV